MECIWQKRQMFRGSWSFLRPIWQGRGKSVAREENRINYEGPHLKFGFILKLIESHWRVLTRGMMERILCFRKMIFIVVWRIVWRQLKQNQEDQVSIFTIAVTLDKRSAGLMLSRSRQGQGQVRREMNSEWLPGFRLLRCRSTIH